MKKYRFLDYPNRAKLDLAQAQEYFSTELLAQGSIFQFDSKEFIVRFDQKLDFLFLILSGKAKIYMVHENGKRSLLQFLEQGDLIGELSLLAVEDQVKDVIAIDSCVCFAIPFVQAKKELLENPVFLRQLSNFLGRKVLKRVDHFSQNQNYELKYRLAAYIKQTEVAGHYQEKHTETAEFLGVSYRHLTYTIDGFKKEGILTKKQNYFLVNFEKLNKYLIEK